MSDIVVIKREDLVSMLHDVAEMTAKKVVNMIGKDAQMRPLHVNQIQAAEMLKMSPSTISRMVKAGSIRLNKCGMIPIDQLEECAK